MLNIKNVSKSFKGKAALKQISIFVEKGKIYGLIGNNGAGKTTLLNCIAMQCTIDNGSILFHDHDAIVQDLKHIAYFMDHSLFDGHESVKEVIHDYAYFFKDFNKERMQTLMEELHIEETSKLKDMSLGTRKKCELAFVLARDAHLYLLDEPFANLDPLVRSELIKLIVRYSREDASYIISTHQIQEIETYIDESILIKDGSLILQASNDVLREEYQCSISELLIKKLAEG